LVEEIPQLSLVEAIAARTSATPSDPAPASSSEGLGVEYRVAHSEARSATREPFSVDPDLVDRALRSHAEIQDSLAVAVRSAGFSPRSPMPGEPVFDLAWEDSDGIVVAEIKSLTERNEERQLRLALGQVLRYAQLLRGKGHPVRSVVAVERRPSDDSWLELCQAAGVLLIWPETFSSIF